MKAIGGVDEVKAMVGKESSIERARISSNEDQGRGIGLDTASRFSGKLSREIGQRLEDGVEVVGGEVVEEDLDGLRRRRGHLSGGVVDGGDDVSDDGQGVWP